jgi:hypothetical protein
MKVHGGSPSLSGNPPPELTPELEGVNGGSSITGAGVEAIVMKPTMDMHLHGSLGLR